VSVSLHRWWWLPRVRAWLQLLIMDECTASVDVQTDQKIQVSARAKENPSLPDSEQRHNQKNDTHENARRKRLVLTKTGSGLQAPQQMGELIRVVVICVCCDG
jgi:hypothetical protein